MEDTQGLFRNQGYELEGLLATDSWGELRSATYVPHRRTVMFRRFDLALADEHIWDLAAAEIQAWARVDHPGVLQPLDWGNAADGPYLATEMPRGALLAGLLAEGDGIRGFDPDEVFDSLLRAIEAAQRWGILHLGLSPASIWVDEGGVSVTEFGLWYIRAGLSAKPGAEEVFLAPEQLGGAGAMAATDVYALGLLHVALHSGLTAAEQAAGGDLSALENPQIAACLAAQPLLRPPSATDLMSSMDLPPGSPLDTFRDCPVCRLKAEIARDLSARQGNVAGRLRRFFDEGRLPLMERPAAGRPRQEPAGPTAPPAGRLVWAAIALLAVLTVVVWFLAFR
jgi:serine/threonine protein kinase